MHLKGTRTGEPLLLWNRHLTYQLGDSIIAKCREGDPGWTLMAEEWPTFLYDEQAGWNENNIRNGLFRGHVLARVGFNTAAPKPLINRVLQVALRVFRNGTAAQADLCKVGVHFDSAGRRGGRKDFLQTNNIKTVTAQMIAYAALQVFRMTHCVPTLTHQFDRHM